MSIIKVKRAKKNGWGSNTLKSYTGARTRVGVQIDKYGNQDTGLTKEDETRLEEAMGFDKGHLRRGSVAGLEPMVNYWTTFTVDMLDTDTITLDTSKPEDEIKYKVLLARKDVAKDMNELKNMPYAAFVLFNDDDEAEKANVRGKAKRLAYTLFESLSPEDMRNLLLIYGESTDTNSNAVVESKLEKYMEDDYNKFLDVARDSNLKDKVFIAKLSRAGIIKKSGQQYVEEGTNEHLAYTTEELVAFLQDKKNNGKVAQYKEALKRIR
jgi:hypothetical protein